MRTFDIDSSSFVIDSPDESFRITSYVFANLDWKKPGWQIEPSYVIITI